MLTRLEISDLRNIERAELRPAAGLNFIVGRNGSGKTSVLEAIHILGRARSFKTLRASEVIRFRQPQCAVVGRVDQSGRPRCSLGVRLAVNGRDLRVGGQKARSSADLVAAFPVLAIHPGSANLVDGSPKQRRGFLDWGVFHVEHDYLDSWRRFSRALSHRNAALRSGADLEPWNQEVARYGTIIGDARIRYLDRLAPLVGATADRFFPGLAVTLSYKAGWGAGRSLLEALRGDHASELRWGCTQSGPHKSDLLIVSEGRPVKTFLSRGQTKLLAYALELAQASLLAECGKPACALIDDLPSELDVENRRRVMHFLATLRCQCFITAVKPDDLVVDLPGDGAMFHVEHGRIMRT